MKFVVREYAPIPRGTYRARLVDIEQRERDGRGYLLWSFEVVFRGDRRRIFRPTSTSFGPSSIARGFVEAILNRDLGAGEEVDALDLLGLECDVVLDVVQDAAGRAVNRVLAVLPADADADADVNR